MDHLQTRLDALEQQMSTLTRQLRWWRSVACALLGLAVLTWVLPVSIAQEEAPEGERERLASFLPALRELQRLLRYLTVVTEAEGRPEVVITGANLRVVNGLGSTTCTGQQGEIQGCPNGLGNLIVGYNELRNNPDFPDVRTGSHNVVVGQQHSFSRIGGLMVGMYHTISGDYASVSGGAFNTASGTWASVSGGNTI